MADEVLLHQGPPTTGIWCGFCGQRLADEVSNVTIRVGGTEGACLTYVCDSRGPLIIGKGSTGVIMEREPNDILHECGTMEGHGG